MDRDTPIVVGLAGQAGTGKTITANHLAPSGRQLYDYEKYDHLYWDHFVLATPLYALASIKQKTEGEDAHNRINHLIHQNMYEVFKSSELPPYQELVNLVQYTAEYRLPPEGTKPRTFLQEIGARMREKRADCFPQFLRHRILQEFNTFMNDEFLENPPPYASVISDVRYPNEIDVIKQFPNGFVIKLTCDEEVRLDRLEHRDGMRLSDEQANHHSETSLDLVDPDLIDVIIDTTNLSVKDQIEHVTKIVELSFL